ncbi:MAG: outer membrane lipoprotein carrier protein LolA [Bacteroidales bacterium]|nr:outer membrane lipoprotein carrier protein LolA [Bacteroidales bacterium]
MKKISLFLVVTVLMSATIFAQSKDLLKQVSDKMASYSTIKAAFSYTMKNTKSGINESQSGNLRVKKSKYFLEIAGQNIYCDGVTVWSVIPDAKEVQINSVADMGDDALTPDKLFTSYYNNFKLKSSEEKNYAGKPAYYMELTPNDKNFEYTKVVLIVEKNTLNPKELQLSDKKGSQYSYILKNLVTNETMSDALFQFDSKKHTDFDIIDLR